MDLCWQSDISASTLSGFAIAFLLLSKLSWSIICLKYRRPWFNSCVRKIHWRRDRLSTPVFVVFPCGSAGKESTCNADLGSTPGLGRSAGDGIGYPLQNSGLVHEVTKSQTRVSDFHCLFLPKSNHLLISWLQSLSAVDCGAQENKIILHR